MDTFAPAMHFFRTNKNHFADEAFFLNAVRKGESKAILYLQDKSAGFTYKLLEQKRLPRHLSGEVLNDACIILLKKLRAPEFELQSAKLSTYFLEIIKYVVLNKTRGRQYAGNTDIDDQQHLQDNTVQEYFERKEQIELIDQLFQKIGPPCSDIIRLKYLDGYADAAVVAQQLSAYSTVESLRVKRSDCMKKLKDMAKKAGHTEPEINVKKK